MIELGIKEYENCETNPDSRSLDNVDIAINKYKNHPSIKIINENMSFESRFNFKDIMSVMSFYLIIYVITEKALTPNTLFFHLLKNVKKPLITKVIQEQC